MLHGKWDLPGPGLEPMSPALAGGFLTTVPPGKSQKNFSDCFYFLKEIITVIGQEEGWEKELLEV